MSLPKAFLKPRRAMPFYNRHPWVFAGALQRIDGEPEPGSQISVYSDKGDFIAHGLYNPNSNIRIRLYAFKGDVDEADALDRSFWTQQIDRAVRLRQQLFPNAAADSAHRLIYSEADGLSGLIVDRYGSWLLVQFTSLALWSKKDLIIELLKEKLNPSGMWLRTEKGIGESEGLPIVDGLLDGAEPPRPLFIEENGVRLGIDVVEGQKTGFYLDQRDNRAAVSRYVKGHRVLDLFCYSGAFGLAAVKHGNAREVLGVDVSGTALTLARANVELNGLVPQFQFEKGKVFDVLERLAEAGEQFDTVILDPPKMTRRRAGLNQAVRGYFSLNRLALDVLKPDGLLVSCSCSGLLSRESFEEVLGKVSVDANRPIQILESRGQAADHPTSVHCPETNYLKCYICRVV